MTNVEVNQYSERLHCTTYATYHHIFESQRMQRCTGMIFIEFAHLLLSAPAGPGPRPCNHFNWPVRPRPGPRQCFSQTWGLWGTRGDSGRPITEHPARVRALRVINAAARIYMGLCVPASTAICWSLCARVHHP